MVVDHKAVARLMRQTGLQVRPLRKFVRTTDSDHDGPIFPNLARGFRPTGPNQLWVGDITYIRIASGFVYLAVILDAWSRRVIGYALGRQIDTRLALAALRAAIETRRPPPGCIHHSESRCAVRGRALSLDTCRTRIGRFDESARQSIQQRESREFHEDDQVRKGLPQ
jgi:putative transposase